MLPDVGAEYLDIAVVGGSTLRVVYEMSIGDLLVTAAIGLLLVFLVLNAIMKLLWR